MLIEAGCTPELIISFSGIGNPGLNRMDFEWKGVLKKLKRREHLIFVKDLSRSWLNQQAGLSDVIQEIKKYIIKNHIIKVTLIGMSMGGSAAISLSSEIGANHVIAINPQIYIGPEAAPWDDRYVDLWSQIDHFSLTDVSIFFNKKIKYTILLSIDDIYDVRHVANLAKSYDNVTVLGIRATHNVGQHFKNYGDMEALLYTLIEKEYMDDLNPISIDQNYLDLVVQAMGGSKSAWPELANIYYSAQHHPFPAGLTGALQDGLLKNIPAETSRPPAHVCPTGSPNTINRYFFGHGWATPDKTGVWSIGSRHEISAHVLDIEDFEEIKIRISFKALVHPKHKTQRVKIHMANAPTEYIHFHLDRDEIQTVVIPVNSSKIDINIHTPDAISPAALGINNDSRNLGIRVTGIEVYGRPKRVYLF